jgi:hypothetical protein
VAARVVGSPTMFLRPALEKQSRARGSGFFIEFRQRNDRRRLVTQWGDYGLSPSGSNNGHWSDNSFVPGDTKENGRSKDFIKLSEGYWAAGLLGYSTLMRDNPKSRLRTSKDLKKEVHTVSLRLLSLSSGEAKATNLLDRVRGMKCIPTPVPECGLIERRTGFENGS